MAHGPALAAATTPVNRHIRGETNEIMLRKKGSIAINTGGGDAPGLNAVIRAVVLSAHARGWETFGILRGFGSLLDRALEPLVAVLLSLLDIPGEGAAREPESGETQQRGDDAQCVGQQNLREPARGAVILD